MVIELSKPALLMDHIDTGVAGAGGGSATLAAGSTIGAGSAGGVASVSGGSGAGTGGEVLARAGDSSGANGAAVRLSGGEVSLAAGAGAMGGSVRVLAGCLASVAPPSSACLLLPSAPPHLDSRRICIACQKPARAKKR